MLSPSSVRLPFRSWTQRRHFNLYHLLIFLVIALLVINYVAVIYLRTAQCAQINDGGGRGDRKVVSASAPLRDSFAHKVTVVIRDFMFFSHDIVGDVEAITSLFPSIAVVVVSKSVPYPPIKLNEKPNVKFVSLAIYPGSNATHHRAEPLITTPYVLLLPDNVWPAPGVNVASMLDLLRNIERYREREAKMVGQPVENSDIAIHKHVRIVASQVAVRTTAGQSDDETGNPLCHCDELDFDVKRWTLHYSKPLKHSAVSEMAATCGAVRCSTCLRQAPLLMATGDLFSLEWDAYDKVTSIALFAQAAARGWKVALMHDALFSPGIATLFAHDYHLQWKANRDFGAATKALYARLGIKRIVDVAQTQTGGKDEFFGCTRKTPRCFGTVVNDAPEFIHAGRWTPPCCLRAIRETGRHVMRRLEAAGVRYWLEGGTLLGAVRHGDIIPWDYDMDIGIFEEDVELLHELLAVKKLEKGGTKVFADGFVWENAREGDFYRVQYSAANHLHVDLWPFRERQSDGMMTKDTWMATHRQDMEFPSHFLKPLGKMEFVGMQVSVPNNVRAFLELKFGPGVIENPRFPGSAEDLQTDWK